MTNLLPSCSRTALSATWPGTPQNAPVARHWVRNRLAAESGDTRYTAELVTGELVANALQHTRSGEPDGTFELMIDLTSRWIWIGVIDQGALVQAEPRPESVIDELPESGRGLALVLGQLAEHWGHDPHGECGRVTWAMIARA